MEYITLNQTQVSFKLTDLVAYLGKALATNFILNYRNAMQVLDNSNIRMQACKFGELVRNYRHEGFTDGAGYGSEYFLNH